MESRSAEDTERGGRPALADALPRGGVLPQAAWEVRHRGICLLLWAHVAALAVIGLAVGADLWVCVLAPASVAACTFLAMRESLGGPVRSWVATLGLLLCSAILIGFSGGMIEAHFHFFIVIAVVSLYQAWSPYLLAVAFVLAHHLVLGTAMPHLVYNHHSATHNPWLFAVIHAGAVLAESIACLVFWRVTEDALDSERAHRDALEQANDELSSANTAVADLVAMLSHDMRAPLAVLIGYSDLAQLTWDEMSPAEQLDFVAMVNRRAHGLKALLEDTLTISALDGEGVNPHPVPVRLDRAVRDALAALPDPDVHVELGDLDGTTAHVDRAHLEQVLTNLLTNAHKYGGGSLSVGAVAEGDEVVVTVADRGPGVPASFVPRLFERFSRADEARSSGQHGTGLGLYIVRSLLLANRGDIAYEETPGGGATFRVRLPRAQLVETS